MSLYSDILCLHPKKFALFVVKIKTRQCFLDYMNFYQVLDSGLGFLLTRLPPWESLWLFECLKAEILQVSKTELHRWLYLSLYFFVQPFGPGSYIKERFELDESLKTQSFQHLNNGSLLWQCLSTAIWGESLATLKRITMKHTVLICFADNIWSPSQVPQAFVTYFQPGASFGIYWERTAKQSDAYYRQY